MEHPRCPGGTREPFAPSVQNGLAPVNVLHWNAYGLAHP